MQVKCQCTGTGVREHDDPSKSGKNKKKDNETKLILQCNRNDARRDQKLLLLFEGKKHTSTCSRTDTAEIAAPTKRGA